MNEDKIFCEECRESIHPYIKSEKMSGKIKGVEYNYIGKIARCSKCNNEIYMPDINDYNLEMLYNEYRAKNNIVSLDVIRSIPQKYAIGKRPLSILLGWGEQTFTRYYDGDVPSKQYSDILKMIYDDPLYYIDILEKNKSRISPVAAQKSLEAATSAIELPQEHSKLNLAAGYLLNQCEDITHLALQKALYYIQGFYYAFYNTFIFTEDCEAWIHGPVYRGIYEKYRFHHFDSTGQQSNFDSSVFTAQEKNILDSIVKNICCYSGKTLELFTHNESPWIDTRNGIPDNYGSNKKISKEIIGKYFSDVKIKYDMKASNDIEKYTSALFETLRR